MIDRMNSPAREIEEARIVEAVARLYTSANHRIPADMRAAMERACEMEESPAGRETLNLLLRNYDTAAETDLPMCQDTGLAVIMAEVGVDARIRGDLRRAIDEGVRRGTREGYLRASIVAHPLRRVNTRDNTPAVVHVSLAPGNRLRLVCLPKGGGSENASALRMLNPADGREGVIDFVVGRVSEQGVNACPPLIVGVGIGANFEGCALLAKRALLRPLGQTNPDPDDAALETELLCRINALGIGPGAFGGSVTTLAVHVEAAPCHIASLPCAVNIQCNAHRKTEVVL